MWMSPGLLTVTFRVEFVRRLLSEPMDHWPIVPLLWLRSPARLIR